MLNFFWFIITCAISVPVMAADSYYSEDDDYPLPQAHFIKRPSTPEREAEDDEYERTVYAGIEKQQEVIKNKLVSGDFIKYIASLLKVDETIISEKKISLATILLAFESQVSVEVENILRAIKQNLDKSSTSHDAIIIGQNKKLVGNSLIRIHELIRLFEDSLIPIFEQLSERSQIAQYHLTEHEIYSLQESEISKILQNARRASKSIYFYIDGYFSNQLLSFAAMFLQPISREGIDDYAESEAVIKMQNCQLLDMPITLASVDSLSSWITKKQHFFMLEHAVKHLIAESHKAEDSGLIRAELDRNLKELFIKFFLNSNTVLVENYNQNISTVSTLADLNQISARYFTNILELHNDYTKNHPELFGDGSNSKMEIETQLYQSLKEVYVKHLEQSALLFLASIKSCEILDDLVKINNVALLITQQFYIDFKTHFPIDIDPSDRFMDISYQKAIASYFKEILNHIEVHYESKRSSLTQALTSLGIRSSQTKLYLDKITAAYQENHPFLFNETSHIGSAFRKRLSDLDAKMTEVDNKGFSDAMSSLSSVTSYLSPSSYSGWWGGSSASSSK